MSKIDMYQSITLNTTISSDETVSIDNDFSGDARFTIAGISNDRMYTESDLRSIRALISRALTENRNHG